MRIPHFSEDIFGGMFAVWWIAALFDFHLSKSCFLTLFLVMNCCGLALPWMILSGFLPVLGAGEGDFSISLAMDSHYVSEGRDNLEEGGIFSTEMVWEKSLADGTLSLGTWYADAWDVDYSELNMSVGYTVDLEPVELGLTYTWLDFFEDDAEDHELALCATFDIQDALDMNIGAVYSDEANGSFFELGLSREFALSDGVAVVPFAVLGINDGYVSDEHDGLNHINIGVETSWEISESISMGAYMSYTMGLEEETGESLEDLFYGGLCLTFSR